MGLASWRIPKEAFTASSELSSNYKAWRGRLGANVGGGAWCSKQNNNAQFLQVDLGYMRKLTHVELQGKSGKSTLPYLDQAWVKEFSLSYSKDGYLWQIGRAHV